MIDIAAFRSPRFKPFLPDGSQVNPGVYGAELAFWLAEALASHGVFTTYPQYEDWGWYLEYLTEDGAEFALDCINAIGSNDRWRVSLRRRPRKWFGRDKPPYSEAARLIAAVRRVLDEEPSISALEWRREGGA